MEDPIDKMRKAFEEAQAMASLTQFAQKSEEAILEEDWKEFVNKVVQPAFEKVESGFFREKHLNVLELKEQPADAGFKVQDFPNAEFWFWIRLRGRRPEAQARRNYGKSPGGDVVLAPL